MAPAKKIKASDLEKRRVRFIVRSHEVGRIIEFSMVRNHVISDYKLIDGEIYELPMDVIKHLHSIKIERTYTEADGSSRRIVDYYYHCEPVDA